MLQYTCPQEKGEIFITMILNFQIWLYQTTRSVSHDLPLNLSLCLLLKVDYQQIQGFTESCIKPQISVTLLYGSFSTLNLPYKEVTEF